MRAGKDLREALESWQDVDYAAYELAVVLGILDPETPFATDAKHVFWSRNELGDTLYGMLTALAKIGALEYNEAKMQSRWKLDFRWRDASARKGR